MSITSARVSDQWVGTEAGRLRDDWTEIGSESMTVLKCKKQVPDSDVSGHNLPPPCPLPLPLTLSFSPALPPAPGEDISFFYPWRVIVVVSAGAISFITLKANGSSNCGRWGGGATRCAHTHTHTES